MPEHPDLDLARSICDFIDRSPSPYHVTANAAEALEAAGFGELDEKAAWEPGGGGNFVRRGGSLIAWIDPTDVEPSTGFVIMGAHTDSPNLRIKPRPDSAGGGFRQVGVEAYGGILHNSWLDRDLGISGRVAVAGPDGPDERLVLIDEPLFRIPQLAPHLDREIRSEGLKLNAQLHLDPISGLGSAEPGRFGQFIAERLEVAADAVLGWDLMLHDLAPSRLVGSDQEFISAPRIDNQLSCIVGLNSILARADAGGPTGALIALFDHEEVGSVSHSGANSAMLARTLERIVEARGGSRADLGRSTAASMIVSADNAHATNPNYADKHDPQHHITLNEGPAIKVNANQRYASEAPTIAAFADACNRAEVPYQRFVSRGDIACGSTIGPMASAATGIATVDVGCPQLSMHSARELSGSADPGYLVAALRALWG